MQASMGPRFANRGYRNRDSSPDPSERSFNGSTVREPWLSFPTAFLFFSGETLQWVHGSRTVVIARSSYYAQYHKLGRVLREVASCNHERVQLEERTRLLLLAQWTFARCENHI